MIILYHILQRIHNVIRLVVLRREKSRETSLQYHSLTEVIKY